MAKQSRPFSAMPYQNQESITINKFESESIKDELQMNKTQRPSLQNQGLLSKRSLRKQSIDSYTIQRQQHQQSFQSFEYAIDDKEFKDIQQDQLKQQQLEERYMPKKYYNVELKAPTPTFQPSKIFSPQNQNFQTISNQPALKVSATQKDLKIRRLQSAAPQITKQPTLKRIETKVQQTLQKQPTLKRMSTKLQQILDNDDIRVNQKNLDDLEQPLHLIAIQKNRSNLIEILTSENMKEVRLKLTEDQVNKLKQKTFEQVKDVYLKDQQQNRLKQYKKVILSRKACDQVAFELRFLPKKQREKLQNKLRWYVVNNVNMDIEIDKGNKVEGKFDQEIDQYFKDNFGIL